MLTFGLLTGGLDGTDLINRALIYLPLALVSLTLHEFGHAAVASALGDPTPRLAGRVTLNPFAHLEVFGTLMMLFGPIGWAKPVPINPSKLKGRYSEILVSFAGPAMNLILALLAAAALKYVNVPAAYDPAVEVLWSFFFLNIGLAVFNMLPIPPLDGSHIWPTILPSSWRQGYYRLLPYGMIALIVLTMWPGANHGLSRLVSVVARWIFGLLP